LLAVALSAGVIAAAGVSLGCVGDQIAAIEATSDARATLFVAEQDWVVASVELADLLTERAMAGVALPGDAKIALRIVRAAGKRALQQARASLAAGHIGEPFASAIADLVQATQSLAGETGRLR